MRLLEFNQCPDDVAVKVLQSCVHIASWINALVAQRPYASIDQLYEAAKQQSRHWQWAEVEQALAQHPRIGERRAAVALSQAEQQFSASEQSGVGTNQQIEQAIWQGNLDYDRQFGHIFLIRAAGRTGAEILGELQRRLRNTPQQEQQEVSEQLAEIALLRLKQGIVV